jgi:phosphatidylglycerol:prolipoprotein diacylglycerol transferase
MTPNGLFAALGGISAILWLRRNQVGLGVTDNEFWAAMWTLLLGGITGAKGLFIILGRHHYARGELHFWADFGTGFVFFGGLVGAVLAGIAFAVVRRLDFLRGADYFAVALPLGHAFGRLDCFSQGCCAGHPPHPVQLYEAAGLVAIAGLGRWVLGHVQTGRLRTGAAFGAYLALYGLLRVLLDPLRADGRPERWLGLSAQQGLALMGLALGLALIIRPTTGLGRRGRPVSAPSIRPHRD